MKITALTRQKKNDNRINVLVDGKYRFSLDMYQVVDLGIRVGREYSEKELDELEHESRFGKLYGRALEYSLMRPHSIQEMRNYLFRKTRDTKYKSRSGEIKDRAGVSQETADRVLGRLIEKGYVDDETFARWWVQNRNLKKGTSIRKLSAELRAKGVDSKIIEATLEGSERSDDEELKKIIAKKGARYEDPQKLMQYLARQGFSYDAIKEAIKSDES